MFKDYAKIKLTAGRGGNGAISFHKEKFIDKGGPDGGDGGRGGSIIFVVDTNADSLQSYVQYKKFSAPDGTAGSRARCAGAKGDDLFLSVPLGTVLYEFKSPGQTKVVQDFQNPDCTYLAAKGGKGGFGNAHFVSSTRQIPRFRELGAPGQVKEYILEIKTIADIGLVGLPNAGKSTFLSVVTQAKPKIADYPFTTLTPNLGILQHKRTSLTIADIPGLIKGAHEGKGLGHDFLRHVERTRLILHLIDINSLDPVRDYHDINQELTKFNPAIADKPQIICFTKIDQMGWEYDNPKLLDYLRDFQKTIKTKSKIFAISSISHSGLDVLKDYMIKQKSKLPVSQILVPETPQIVSRPNSSVIVKKPGHFIIYGDKIEQFATQTDFDNPESMQRIRDIFHKIGIDKQLKKLSVKAGDIIQINNQIFNW